MKNLVSFILVIMLFVRCSNGGGSDDSTGTGLNPESTVLSYPESNSQCIQGENITALKSTIVFKWNQSKNTDSYDLVLKDLSTGTIVSYPSVTNQLSINLSRGTPYSWYVVSKLSTSTKTANSETWKFYNAGDGIVNYAPFPAEAVSPYNAEILNSGNGKISLNWITTDIDNDIKAYDIYFGTETIPQLYKSDIKENILADVSVVSKTVYYWYVITKDKYGNKAKSEIFTFSIQ